MTLQWSDEDRLFLVTIPEFADLVMMPCTHGKTREEAIRNGEEVIEMYLEAWQAEEQTIPEPRNELPISSNTEFLHCNEYQSHP